jgi:hypothetical protein
MGDRNCISFIAAPIPVFAFGTIVDMMFRQLRPPGFKPILWILIPLLAYSCASPAPPPLTDPTPDPVSSDTFPTPTPFQPGDAPNSSVDVLPPQPAPTYTPFPMKYVSPQNGTAPEAIVPSLENSVIVNNPLTGLPPADPALLQRRPIIVKIGNAPDYVRPQSGLTLADVVYEYYIEWGETRFAAIFYGNDASRVGPVRSGRFLDEHLTRMYHSFFFFKGADDRAMTYYRSLDISDYMVTAGLGGNCPPFFVGPYRRDAYNNVFFDTSKWSACTERRGVDNSLQTISGGFFAEKSPESALSISRINIYYSIYSYGYWEYDAEQQRYFRYQEANDLTAGRTEAYALLTDDLTRLPVTAENVVVLFVPYIYVNTYNAKDEVYHIDLIDYGNAYVFRDGIALPARWKRPERDQPILLTTLDGAPIYLRPGRTFYQIIGTTSTYQLNGSECRFVFKTP